MELFAADGHDAGGCERVTGKSGMRPLVLQKREARTGRNPATGEAIEIPPKQVVKARIAKQLKDAVLPEA